MRVRQGWSGEVEPNQWAKFDVELEEDDLRRLLAAASIYPGSINTTLAFQLLEVEAEFLVMAKLIARYGYPGDKGAAKLVELSAAKDKLLTEIRSRQQVKPAPPDATP